MAIFKVVVYVDGQEIGSLTDTLTRKAGKGDKASVVCVRGYAGGNMPAAFIGEGKVLHVGVNLTEVTEESKAINKAKREASKGKGK